MSTLDNVVQVTISAAGPTPTQAGFGVPMIAAYHTETPNMVDSYSDLDGVAADFDTSSPTYRKAAAMFAQNPAPPLIMVGKRLHAFTKTVTLTPIKLTEAYKYAFNIFDHTGVKKAISYTVQAGDDAADVVTGLSASAGSLTDITITGTDTLILTSDTPGNVFRLTELPGASVMTVSDGTTDPGIVNDITDIAAVNSSGWYGLVLDSDGKDEIEALAVWVEANEKLYSYTTTDSTCADPNSTTDVMAALKTSAYRRTFGTYLSNSTESCLESAWFGRELNFMPGTTNWAFVTLAGIPVDTLLTAELNAVLGKNGNTYILIGGLNNTYMGKVPSGEWVDIVHGTDWLSARIQERVYGEMKAASDRGSKIPYTNDGANVIVSAVMAVLAIGVDPLGNGAPGLLAKYPAPTCGAPDVSTVSPSDKQGRYLPNVTFTATYAGAITKAGILGNISF